MTGPSLSTLDNVRRRILTPMVAAFIALAAASAFVGQRVDAVGWDGFVTAGAVTAQDTSLTTYVYYGYDGQFFYRLAVAPFSTAERVDGIVFDAPAYRQQRIAYPLLAWVLAAVSPMQTVHALVVVNLAALTVVTYQLARLAQDANRSPFTALLFLAWPALVFSLGMDLSEIVALAFVVTAIRLALRGDHSWAAAALCGAVLTRESTALLAVLAILHYRRRAYVIPIAVLAAWQLFIWRMWGQIPGLESLPAPGERLLTVPPLGLIEGAGKWGLLDVAVAVTLLVVAWIGGRHFARRSFIGLSFLAYGALITALGWPVWESWRGFSRAAVEFVTLAFLLRIGVGRAMEPSAADRSATA